MNAAKLASLRRTALFVMIGSIAVTALFAIGAFLIGHFSHTEVRILLTTLAVATSSGLSLASGSSWPARRALPLSGVSLAIVAFVAALPPIWLRKAHHGGWGTWIRGVGILYVIAAALAYATLLIARRRAADSSSVTTTRLAALLSLAWLTVMISLLIATERFSGDNFGRVLGVAAVLTVATTLITLILQRLETPARRAAREVGGVTGHTIVSVEKRESETLLVLDDGRRLPLAPTAKLD
ncbi:MAG TPA: hypothetical protein VII83_08235 [Gaiellaceae bacterium]